MKKFLLRLIMFGVLLVPIYCVLLLVNQDFTIIPKRNLKLSNSKNLTEINLSEVDGVKEIDVLFIGSSHTYRSYDPRIFSERNIEVYNLGTSSQTPIQSLSLLHTYFNNLKPSIIVLDAYPVLYTLDGFESQIDLINHDKITANILMSSFKINHPTVYNTLLYSILKGRSNENKLSINPKDNYISKGFVERNESLKKLAYEDLQMTEINSSQIMALKDIKSFCLENNTDLILIRTPEAKDYSKYLDDNINFKQAIKNLDLNYINWNDSIKLNDSLDFYDIDHLNKNGVKKYNQSILNLIENRLNQNTSMK